MSIPRFMDENTEAQRDAACPRSGGKLMVEVGGNPCVWGTEHCVHPSDGRAPTVCAPEAAVDGRW